MSKILLCGLAPLPYENELKSFGPGVRTWQLAKPLIEDGHDVTLLAYHIPKAYPSEIPEPVETRERGMRRISVGDRQWQDHGFLKGLVEEVRPDALVGSTIYGSFAAVRAAGTEPVWVDLFGHVMAEAQARAAIEGENHFVPYFWSYEREVILRGDRFSTVGDGQAYATIGELGAAGRLRKETLGYRFVSTIPCALDEEPLVRKRTVLRGVDVASDDFVLLWSGGYNTWTDVDTLFQALDQAMAKNPRVRFVSTGGAIDGHDEHTYPRFLRMIEESHRRDRFVMKGWIRKEEATDHYFEADVGINIDKYMYEGLLGSKNRILDWMRAGLPALTGELSEITRLLKEHGLGFVFPLGDADALAAEILRLADAPELCKEAGRRARAYGLGALTFGATTAPLRDWCKRPERAPDSYQPTLLDGFSSSTYVRKLEGEVKKKTDYIVELEGHFQKLAGLLEEKDRRIAELYARGNGALPLWRRAKSGVKRLLVRAGMGAVVERIRNR